MAKINKKNVYPDDSKVSMHDSLIGSDFDEGGKTKNFPISAIALLILEFISENLELSQDNYFRFIKGNLAIDGNLTNELKESEILNQINNYLSSTSIEVSQLELIVFSFTITHNEKTHIRKYLFPNMLGKGVYSPLSESFNASDLELIYVDNSFYNNSIDDELYVHKAGEEIITGKKIFSADLEIKSISPEVKFHETMNNQFITIKTRDLGDGSLVLKNQNNKNLLLIKNPAGLGEPQLAIGNVNTIPTESQLYVFGGNNGANIDMRGRADRDECNIDLEGNDWDTGIPNSLGFSYFGSKYNLDGHVLGYPKFKLAHIRFNEVDNAIISSSNQYKVVPIRFGINGNEVVFITRTGAFYKDDYSGQNVRNKRWIPDKEYVDSRYTIYIPLSGTIELQPVTGSIQFENSINIFNNNETEDTISTIGFEDGTIALYSTKNSSGFSGSLRVTPAGINIDNTDPSSKGITGAYDYTANVESLDYIQAKYVHDKFIPLNGTEEGKEITGNLAFKDMPDFDYALYASDNSSNGYTQVLNFNSTGLYLSTFDNDYGTILQVYRDEVVIFSSKPDSKGLVGNADFTKNASPLAYIQRKYVDDRVSIKFMTELGTLNPGVNQKTIFFPDVYNTAPEFVQVTLGGGVSDGFPTNVDELYSHTIRSIYNDRVIINIMRIDSMGAPSSQNIRAYVSVKTN